VRPLSMRLPDRFLMSERGSAAASVLLARPYKKNCVPAPREGDLFLSFFQCPFTASHLASEIRVPFMKRQGQARFFPVALQVSSKRGPPVAPGFVPPFPTPRCRKDFRPPTPHRCRRDPATRFQFLETPPDPGLRPLNFFVFGHRVPRLSPVPVPVFFSRSHRCVPAQEHFFFFAPWAG